MARMRTVVAGTALIVLLATGCEWHFEVLDGNGGSHGQIVGDVGDHNAVILYNGRPHVFYQDRINGDLRHAYWNGQFWAFETLDGSGGPNGRVSGGVGEHTTAVLYNGRPHVFYYQGSGINSGGDLRHGYWNGQFWAFETLDGNGGPNGRVDSNLGQSNEAILYDDRPHVFYFDVTVNELRHAYYTGAAWGFETLDGHQTGPHGQVNSSVGFDNSAVLYNGRPHVFYRTTMGDEDLRHGYWNGQFWAFETLDGLGGPNGRIDANVGEGADAILYNGRPHVFYRDSTATNLRHAYYTGAAWGFETLDGHQTGPHGQIPASVGSFNAAVLYNDRPHVFYYSSSGTDDLRHGYWNGQFWAFETLDGSGGPNGRIAAEVGTHNAALIYNGGPHVFYRDDTNGNLRHGWFG